MILALNIMSAVFFSTAAVPATPPPQEAKEEKKVCRSEKMTGSLTRVRRICMTQREWDNVAASTRRGLNDLDRQQNTNVGGGPS